MIRLESPTELKRFLSTVTRSTLPALIEKIDALLPQTQCTQCDYPRCYDYAEAIAKNQTDINQCPPGNDITIKALSELTGKEAKPLNPENGEHESKLVALIEESACIGCKLCIKACPVDCIIGAGKRMHTVIQNECTGCKLCVPACPTDCIDLIPFSDLSSDAPPSKWPDFSQPQVDKARKRTNQKIARMLRKKEEQEKRKIIKKRAALQQEIRAALERKRAT